MKNGFANLTLAIALTAAGMAAWAMPARAAATLKFGYPSPPRSYINTEGVTPWIHEVEKASNGTLTIKLFAGTTLGTERNIYARTLANVAQISFGVFDTIASQFPLTQVTTLPFLEDDATTSSVALWRLYAKGLLDPAYKNVKVLALFTYPGDGLDTKRPIKTIADLKGMKLATETRMLGHIVVALGASPVTLTPTELYQGMSRGMVDGIVTAWPAVRVFRLDEVTKYHLEAHLGQGPSYVFMNKAAYAALPAQAKHAIDEYSGESFSKKLGAINAAANRVEAKKVAAEPGQFVSQLSPAQYKVWKARLQPVTAAWEKRTPGGAKVLAAYSDEIKEISAAN